MEARVKEGGRFVTVSACGGLVFSVKEFRPVPAGLEAEAEANPLLDVREEGDATAELVLAENVVAPHDLGEVESIELQIDASPGAIAFARKLGIDLSQVEGSGADGKIIKADVTKFAKEG